MTKSENKVLRTVQYPPPDCSRFVIVVDEIRSFKISK